VSWQPKPRNTYTNSYDSQPGLQAMNRKIKAQLRALVLARAPEESRIEGRELRFCLKLLHFCLLTFAEPSQKLLDKYHSSEPRMWYHVERGCVQVE
jgi:hypothetical protein